MCLSTPFLRYCFFWTWFIFVTTVYTLSFFTTFHVSVYAMLFTILLIGQLVLSFKNRLFMEKTLDNNIDITSVSVDLVVVGYRENKHYWVKCLESVCAQTFFENMNVVVSIDGNDPDDQYMGETARCILPRSAAIFMHAHGGKRSAIAGAYRYIANSNSSSQYIILIDSDTILQNDAVEALVRCIHTDSKIGCATGNIRVADTGSFLRKVINARYSYAFNIERSCLSCIGIMTCCSGPLSIYRKSVVTQDFVNRFATQTIAGYKVEPGDDRHQTLLVLAGGHKSKMTPYSICYTDCPDSFDRFLCQQLRWMRSFYREQIWQYLCIPHQPMTLTIVMVYELLFPLFILVWIICLLFFTEPDVLLFLKSAAITFGVAVLRTVLVVAHTKDFRCMYNVFYVFIYLHFILPVKMYALFTVLNNGWVTSDRMWIRRNLSVDALCMYCVVLVFNSVAFWGVFRYFATVYDMVPTVF